MAKRKSKRRKRQIGVPENLAGVLAGAAVVLGCFVRVRLTNLYDDMGSAYLSVALQWFILLFVPVGAGMFGAVSDMVLSRVERGSVKGARRVVRTAALGGALCGLILWAAGTVLSGFLTKGAAGLPLAGMALKGFLPALLPLSVALALTGGMDGFGSQGSVRFVKFLFCLLLFIAGPVLTSPFLEYGQKVGAFLQNEQYGPAFGALGGAIGLVAVSVVAMVAAGVGWWNIRPAIVGLQRTEDFSTEKQGQILKGVFAKSLPILLPALLIMIGMIGETLLFLKTAEEEALNEKALLWGIYAGKSRVILEIPVFLAFAYAARMLPELKVGYLSRNLKKTREKSMITLRSMALMMVPLAVYFAVSANAVVDALYQTGEMEQAAALLRIGSIAVVFFGLAAGLAAILKSADLTMPVVLDTLICVAVHLAALYVMLYFLNLDIYAVVYASIILAVGLCFAYFFSVQRQMKIRLSWIRILLGPCVGGAVMAAVCALVSLVVLKNASGIVNALFTGVIGFAVYFVVVLLLKGATRKELLSFWGGERIVAVAKLLRIL